MDRPIPQYGLLLPIRLRVHHLCFCAAVFCHGSKWGVQDFLSFPEYFNQNFTPDRNCVTMYAGRKAGDAAELLNRGGSLRDSLCRIQFCGKIGLKEEALPLCRIR